MGFSFFGGHDSPFGWHSASIPPPKPPRRNQSIGSRTGLTTTAPSSRTGRSRSGSTRRRCPAGGRATARASAGGRLAERSAVMGWVLSCLAGNLWARMVSACAATALTILLFLLNLRHAGERAGWLGNAFHPCREHMQSNARCWTQPAAALGVAMIWLGGCAMVSSEPRASICPSVVEYSPAAQAR